MATFELLQRGVVILVLLISARLRDLHAWKGTGEIGVDYGLNGDNLPSPVQIVALLRSKGITRVRIYDARQDITQAFVNSGIDLMIGVPNDLVPKIAGNLAEAINWVTQNVAQFSAGANISAVIVGNEWFLDLAHDSALLLPAMLNIYTVLTTPSLVRNLDLSSVKVSTCFAFNVLNISYPPSAAVFQESLLPVLRPLLDFLHRTGSFFMVNIFPYFAYVQDPNVSLEFALFEAKQPVQDPKTKVNYTNLFDMQLDAVYAALHTYISASMQELDSLVDKKVMKSGSDPWMRTESYRTHKPPFVVAGESGWPSGHGSSRTPPNAAAASVLPLHSLRAGDDHATLPASSSAAPDIFPNIDHVQYAVEESLLPTLNNATSRDHGVDWKNTDAKVIRRSDQLQEPAAASTPGASTVAAASDSKYKCSGRECTAASLENARTYNQNLIRHVLKAQGTPANPTTPIRAFVFEIFNEDLKPPGPEQHFGLFFPNSTPVYPITFH